MGSLSRRRANPSRRDKGGGVGRAGHDDPTVSAALINMENGVLEPYMSREFSKATLDHIQDVVFSEALEAGDKELVILCEKVLAKYGRAFPNHVSGLWAPLEVPRNELQVRELFVGRLPEYGYRLVSSHADFPDWLLVDNEGCFVYAEVEHRSHSFYRHGHDPQMCDLIVCWEHDWADTPLPILELFTGTLYQPKVSLPRRKWRGALPVNFAGRLKTDVRSETLVQLRGRAQYAVNRFQELSGEGKSRGEAVRILAHELGVTGNHCRAMLRQNASTIALGKSRKERMHERVQELLSLGHSKRSAIDTTAQEFRIKPGSVESALSRYKNHS